MTKQQAIRTLTQRGWKIEPEGRSSVWATDPAGQRGLYDPRDLLAELTARRDPAPRGAEAIKETRR